MLYNGSILMTEDKQHAWKRVEDKWEALPAIPDETIPRLSHYVSLDYNNNPFHYILKQYYIDEEEYEYWAEQHSAYGGVGYSVFASAFPTTDGRFTYIVESFARTEEDYPDPEYPNAPWEPGDNNAPWETIVQTSQCPPMQFVIHRVMYTAFLKTIEETSQNDNELDDVSEETFNLSIRLGESIRMGECAQ